MSSLAAIDALIQSSVREGVEDERNLPFFLVPDGPLKAALVMAHGFSASPWEMRLLADKLALEGYAVLGLRLPGHGTTPEDLERRVMEEWVETVQEGFRLMRGRYPQVYGVGLSVGALTQLVAAPLCQPDGLLLLSAFLRTRHRLTPLAGWLHPLRRWRTRPVLASEAHAYYNRQPVRAIHQINRLIRQAKRVAPTLTMPVLMLNTVGDATIDPFSAITLFRHIGSNAKALHLFGPQAPHVLTASTNPLLGDVLRLSRMFFQGQQPAGLSTF